MTSDSREYAEAPSIAPIAAQTNDIGRSVLSTKALNEQNVIRRKLNSYVGFANLPTQWHKKSVKKGFNLNVMVVGETGLGKSTLINTLFNSSFADEREHTAEGGLVIPQTVRIHKETKVLSENGVRLQLSVIDTPGFGDFVNNAQAWEPIVKDIESRFDSYLEMETKINRTHIDDERIHACIYFIQPTGHSLKPLDIVVMKSLHEKVNLIPVIAKSDTMTEEEVQLFKRRILADIAAQKISIFRPPKYDNDDEETLLEQDEIMSAVPFAVVGSTETVATPDGRQVRGRSYPWGVIEVDNEEHCDFVKLRQLLIRNYLEELREKTANVLYENYRSEKLTDMGIQQDDTVFREVNPAMRQEEERAQHDSRLAKMENDMKAVFQQKVQEKEEKLKKSEAELFARHRQMKEELNKQREKLEEKKAALEAHRVGQEEKKARKGFSLGR